MRGYRWQVIFLSANVFGCSFSSPPHVKRFSVFSMRDFFVGNEASPNMSSSPTGCCAVQWAMWKGGGLTSRDRLDSSENYLLLGFLLVRLSQTVLLLVRQPITQNNCSISVSYRSSSNVTWLKNLLTVENKMKLLKRVELGQETIKCKNEVLPFFVNYEIPWRPPNKCKQTNEHQIFNLRAAITKVSQLPSAAHSMHTS